MSSSAIAIGLSLFAGLSTMIGAVFAVQVGRNDEKMLGCALAFSAGVMASISVLEFIPEGFHFLEESFGTEGMLCFGLSIMGGAGCGYVLDRYLPEQSDSVYKVGLFSCVALFLHNLPEGIATFVAGCHSVSLGVTVAISIALHNIPEGIMVAMPIYQATGSKKKGLWYAFVSGMSEPLGAVLTALFLLPFISDALMGLVFGLVAGIMMYIALAELLPLSLKTVRMRTLIFPLVFGFLFIPVLALIG